MPAEVILRVGGPHHTQRVLVPQREKQGPYTKSSWLQRPSPCLLLHAVSGEALDPGSWNRGLGNRAKEASEGLHSSKTARATTCFLRLVEGLALEPISAWPEAFTRVCLGGGGEQPWVSG